MRALYAAVSGLQNNQTAMDVIGNNISNVNTTGFKSSTVNFQDVLSQTLQAASTGSTSTGGTNPVQVGLGMSVASTDLNFTDGSFTPTGNSANLAIQGSGFFVLSNGSNQLFTRSGNFDFDNTGNYVVPGTGYKVMGWMANSSGVIDSSGTEVALKVPVGTTMPAKVTDNITYSNNLQSSDTLGASSQTSIDVYDSKGTAHSVDQTFVNTGTNQWLVKATVPDADGTTQNSLNLVTFGADGKYGNTSTVTGFTPNNVNFTSMGLDNTLNSVGTGYFTVIDASGNPTQYALTTTNTSSDNWSYSIANATDPSATVGSGTGTISYNGSQYVFSTPSFTYGSPAQSVTLGTPIINDTPGTTTTMASKDYTYSSGVYNNLAFGVSDGANPMSIDLLMSGLTQYGGTSTVQATDQDGYASGTLSNTTINNVGVLVGSFSNGQSQDLAQVSLATFNNPQGLDQIGDNMFSVSDNSGVPQVGVANSGGRGTFSSGTLESSNVDLATEFSNMITTENAYNANSKVISTVNQMLQQLDNLIQG